MQIDIDVTSSKNWAGGGEAGGCLGLGGLVYGEAAHIPSLLQAAIWEPTGRERNSCLWVLQSIPFSAGIEVPIDIQPSVER